MTQQPEKYKQPLIANGVWSKIAFWLLTIIFAAGQAYIYSLGERLNTTRDLLHALEKGQVAIETTRFKSQEGAALWLEFANLRGEFSVMKTKLDSLPPAAIAENTRAIKDLQLENAKWHRK